MAFEINKGLSHLVLFALFAHGKHSFFFELIKNTDGMERKIQSLHIKSISIQCTIEHHNRLFNWLSYKFIYILSHSKVFA